MSVLKITLGKHTYLNNWDTAGKDKWVVQSFNGWFGGVGVNLEKQDRVAKHGTFPAASYRQGRSMTLLLVAEASSEAKARELAREASGMGFSDGQQRLTVVWDGDTFFTDVVVDGAINVKFGPSDSRTDFVYVQVPLYAADPFIYGRLNQAGTNVQGTSRGTYPGKRGRDGFLFNGDPVLPPNIIQRGNVPGYPMVEVHGNFPDGFIVWVGNKPIEWRGSVTDESPVTVDGRGRVFQSGRDVTFKCWRTSWPELAPGAGYPVRLDARLGRGGGYAVVSAYDTYL